MIADEYKNGGQGEIIGDIDEILNTIVTNRREQQSIIFGWNHDRIYGAVASENLIEFGMT